MAGENYTKPASKKVDKLKNFQYIFIASISYYLFMVLWFFIENNFLWGKYNDKKF